MPTSNSRTQTFGYRTVNFIIFITIILCALAFIFLSWFGLALFFLASLYANIETLDLKKITLSPDLLYITRYLRPHNYDVKFWLKDVVAASVYHKVKHGKSIHADGGRMSSTRRKNE